MALDPLDIGDNVETPGIAAEIYVPDQLIAGRFPLVTATVTLASGTLARGTVLGQVTTSGDYIECVKTAEDGSQNPAAILADAADASGGAVITGAYLSGEFNQNYLTFDSSWTLATLAPLLRATDIFLKSSVSSADPTNPS